MTKKSLIDQYELPIRIKKEGKWYLASCPKWINCFVQARSVDEATSEMFKVAKTLIELYQDKGLDIPLNLVKRSDSSKTISFNLRCWFSEFNETD